MLAAKGNYIPFVLKLSFQLKLPLQITFYFFFSRNMISSVNLLTIYIFRDFSSEISEASQFIISQHKVCDVRLELIQCICLVSKWKWMYGFFYSRISQKVKTQFKHSHKKSNTTNQKISSLLLIYFNRTRLALFYAFFCVIENLTFGCCPTTYETNHSHRTDGTVNERLDDAFACIGDLCSVEPLVAFFFFRSLLICSHNISFLFAPTNFQRKRTRFISHNSRVIKMASFSWYFFFFMCFALIFFVRVYLLLLLLYVIVICSVNVDVDGVNIAKLVLFTNSSNERILEHENLA